MMAITRLCAVVALAGLTMTWAIAASAVTARQDAPGAGTTVPPSETEVGFPIFPSSTFLTSYDAGRGQRYYLYGTDSGFEEMVRYYSVVLDEDGDQVFNAPATHVFEIGRFREETMAFPPGVTIKDYAWNGSEGYLDPTPGSTTRYATVIQIVPVPSGATER
jgi:hypothetical protein